MTTMVVVHANHGPPVKVTKIYPNNSMSHTVVPPDMKGTFYVHDGCDIHVHEIQPNEPDYQKYVDLAKNVEELTNMMSDRHA